jgi:flagellar motor component MotA
MSSIGGILLVFACVIVGYLMEKGEIGVKQQPIGLSGGSATGACGYLHVIY